MYRCAICDTELFPSDAKFNSGTGWPSFTEPANSEHITFAEDTREGMKRTEVLCKKCGAHLGHIFEDGPEAAVENAIVSIPYVSRWRRMDEGFFLISRYSFAHL